MTLFDWNEKLEVDIEELDGHHKRLIGYVNDLYQAISERRSREVLSGILHGLLEYTGSHFAAEERLMDEHDYPGYPAHKKEHDELTAQVRTFLEEFDRKEGAISMTLLTFLREWVVNHIQVMDRKYAPFLKDRGIA